MGLMRALTLKRQSVLPTRSNTLKGRPQISLPTELISTTNNLTYTAPSVESMQQKAASEQLASASVVCESETSSITVSEVVSEELQCPQTTTVSEDSSRRSSHQSTASGSGSPPSLTDASSVSSSPSTPYAPQTFLSAQPTSYFSIDSFSKPSSRNSTISFLDDSEIDPLTVVVPALPRRAPSHSKREHERLARRRSQCVSTKPLAVAAPSAALDAAEDVLSPAPAAMPELKEVDEEVVPQVTVVEVAEAEQESKTLEQLLAEMVMEDEEACYMREHGLKKFSVGGYLDLVGDVWASELLMVEGVAVLVA